MSEQFKTMEVYCQNNVCGDPVPSITGVVYYKRRRMFFTGISFTGALVFKCPVCGKNRKFRERLFGGLLDEI